MAASKYGTVRIDITASGSGYTYTANPQHYRPDEENGQDHAYKSEESFETLDDLHADVASKSSSDNLGDDIYFIMHEDATEKAADTGETDPTTSDSHDDNLPTFSSVSGDEDDRSDAPFATDRSTNV